jgi:hypothetical protein
VENATKIEKEQVLRSEIYIYVIHKLFQLLVLRGILTMANKTIILLTIYKLS